MRLHVTNWSIKNATQGESIINMSPPGRILNTFITEDGAWLRVVSVENDTRSMALFCDLPTGERHDQVCNQRPATHYDGVGWRCDAHAPANEPQESQAASENESGPAGRLWALGSILGRLGVDSSALYDQFALLNERRLPNERSYWWNSIMSLKLPFDPRLIREDGQETDGRSTTVEAAEPPYDEDWESRCKYIVGALKAQGIGTGSFVFPDGLTVEGDLG